MFSNHDQMSVETSTMAERANAFPLRQREVHDPVESVIPNSRTLRIQHSIKEASELLPISGPISAFAFLNTLQALENLPFDAALQKGAELYGCQPYLSEDKFREKLSQGRIRKEDLEAVLRDDLGDRATEPVGPHGTLYDLRLAMMRSSLLRGPAAELRWFVSETDALRQLRSDLPIEVRRELLQDTRHWVMRHLSSSGENQEHAEATNPTVNEESRKVVSALVANFAQASFESWSEQTWEAFTLQALWHICVDGSSNVEPGVTSKFVTNHRELIRQVTLEDLDLLLNELLIPFCAAFTDQGFAQWTLPDRDAGFYRAFVELYHRPGGTPDAWQQHVPAELSRLRSAGIGPLESLVESLDLLGVDDVELDDFIIKELLALRGWAGMLHQMEVRGDRVPTPVPAGTLLEYLAVRLVLERIALTKVAHEKLNYDGPLDQLRKVARDSMVCDDSVNIEQRAFLVFQLAQLMGWCPSKLAHMTAAPWRKMISEIESFTSLERRRLFQLAYERGFRIQTLDAIAFHPRHVPTWKPAPRFQTIYCIDAREESFRRHLEEVAPDTETFSAAGFFGVTMYFRGAADANFAASCPVVVRPQHWVEEEVVYTLQESHRNRARARRALGTATRRFHLESRGMTGGALLTMSLGLLASVPLVARVLFPRWTARVTRLAGSMLQPPPVTRLRMERQAVTPGPVGDQIGYTVDEMANIGERTLRDIGLTSGFSRLVMFLGHGSFCLNNPHKSAYDCGACTRAGGANARAIAIILNDVRVREILSGHGLKIPRDTVFLGGLHNTCDDTITFADLDLLPSSHIKDYEAARRTLEAACERNAHERCRRFYSAPLTISQTEAMRHVERRAEDLSQTRPEYGNASNAICVVGRRSRTRGLYLDRRPFLMSYDPTQDDGEHNILARILSAVVPVCEGINMQYYLSHVDSTGWGSGTKLPHNVASLLGVMNGATSDLLPGLPWQSVEIHEPLRCLFVIETTVEAMNSIMERNPVVGRILRNGWVQLAVLSPESARIQVFHNGTFQPYSPEAKELPNAASSVDWYRGWRDHLTFAEIRTDSDRFSQNDNPCQEVQGHGN